MPKFEDLYFNSSNGVNIVRARKCCPDGEARAVLQISHGIAEHIGRYEDFMLFLAENGIVLKYGYSFMENRKGRFFMAMRVEDEDVERAEDILEAAGFKPIVQDDLRRLFV